MTDAFDRSGRRNSDVVNISSLLGPNFTERKEGILNTSFMEALAVSYNSVDGVSGEQFMRDAARCSWHIGGRTYGPEDMSKLLETYSQIEGVRAVDKKRMHEAMRDVAQSSYRVPFSTFSTKFAERKRALLTFSRLLKPESESVHSSMELLDSVVSLCQQGGTTSILYFQAMEPIKKAMQDAHISSKGTAPGKLCEDIFVAANKVDRYVDVAEDGGIRVAEKVNYVFRSADTEEQRVIDLLEAEVVLRYNMHSEGKGIAFKDCSATVKVVPLRGLKIKTDRNWYRDFYVALISAINWCVNKMRNAFYDDSKSGYVFKLPVLKSVSSKHLSSGEETVELQYSIPPVVISADDLYELRKECIAEVSGVDIRTAARTPTRGSKAGGGRNGPTVPQHIQQSIVPTTLEEAELRSAALESSKKCSGRN